MNTAQINGTHGIENNSLN